MTGPAEADPRALQVFARTEGARWASAELESLARAGRPPAGGWPGTRSEARARMEAALMAGRLPCDPRGIDELAGQMYDAAREHWRARSVREPPA